MASRAEWGRPARRAVVCWTSEDEGDDDIEYADGVELAGEDIEG